MLQTAAPESEFASVRNFKSNTFQCTNSDLMQEIVAITIFEAKATALRKLISELATNNAHLDNHA